MSESQLEFVEQSKTKVEQILERSHFAGNFSEKGKSETPDKDLLMVDLDEIKDYVQFLPHLPAGFGFTGGVARGALLELLGDKSPSIRDVDVEGIREMIRDNLDRRKVSNEYPPGIGRPLVVVSNSLVEYFSTRDFTINEVFLYGNDLYFSRRALEAMDKKLICPSDNHEVKASDWTEIPPLLRFKALLLQLDFIKSYGYSDIGKVKGWNWELGDVKGFDLALSLKKASEKDNHIPFLKELIKLRVITQAVLPDGYTEDSVRRVAGLAVHWMIHRDDDDRDFHFGSDYFDKAYTEEMRQEDDRDLDMLLHQASNSVKYKNVSVDDLNW